MLATCLCKDNLRACLLAAISRVLVLCRPFKYLYSGWHVSLPLIATTQFAVCSAPPTPKLSALGDRKTVIPTTGNVHNSLRGNIGGYFLGSVNGTRRRYWQCVCVRVCVLQLQKLNCFDSLNWDAEVTFLLIGKKE